MLILIPQRGQDDTFRHNPTELNLLKENAILRERIAKLELAFAQAREEQCSAPNLTVSTAIEDHSQRTRQYEQKLAEFEHEQELLEDWSHGQLQKEKTEVKSDGRPSLDVLSILPSREESTRVVNFSLQMLGWIHCALRVDIFQQEHEQFWDRLEAQDTSVLENHSWLMVYFSVLAVGGLNSSSTTTNAASDWLLLLWWTEYEQSIL